MLYKYIMCKLHMFVFSSKDASGATTVSAQKVNRTEYDQTRVGAWNGLRPPAKRTMGDPKAKAKGHSQGLPKSKKSSSVPKVPKAKSSSVCHAVKGFSATDSFIDEAAPLPFLRGPGIVEPRESQGHIGIGPTPGPPSSTTAGAGGTDQLHPPDGEPCSRAERRPSRACQAHLRVPTGRSYVGHALGRQSCRRYRTARRNRSITGFYTPSMDPADHSHARKLHHTTRSTQRCGT